MADDHRPPPAWVPRTALVLAYPGFTALDLFGPQWFLAAILGMTVQTVARTRDPVTGDAGATVVPAHSYVHAPEECDILLVPGGGPGAIAAMSDAPLLAFLRARAARARIVASTCTGSLVLGAAGLLRGRRATSHWLVRDAVLPRLGATPVAARVVEDGTDLITAAGVTAGLDLGLALVRRLAGDDYARQIALLAEYPGGAPQVDGTEPGVPETAEAIRAIFAPLLAQACEAADRAAAGFRPARDPGLARTRRGMPVDADAG
jgi:transcriptional regulator GlxA family with amidase domain